MMQPYGCDQAYDARRRTATNKLRVRNPVRRSVVLPAAPSVVWLALTDREELRAWFGADVEIEPRPGGDVRATWPDGARSVGSVEVAEEPTRLVFRWRRIDGVGFHASVSGATRIAFAMEQTAGGTSVTVTEAPIELASLVDAP
jgi:uncharacterized protein YndB with AHSA1/START domain